MNNFIHYYKFIITNLLLSTNKKKSYKKYSGVVRVTLI